MSETCDCSECKQDLVSASRRKHAEAIAAAEERGRRRGEAERETERLDLMGLIRLARHWMRADAPSWIKAKIDTALGAPRDSAPVRNERERYESLCEAAASGSAEDRELARAAVFSRDECPFNYCDQEQPWTACRDRCRHAPRDSGKAET